LYADNPTSPAAVVFGCAGLKLNADEKSLFSDCNPAGFILFARNIANPDQVRHLIDDLRQSVGHNNPLVLVDQEGGRVQRLTEPHWPKYPSMKPFGDRFAADPTETMICLLLNYRLIANDLVALGFNVDCAPVLDLPVPGSHDIIGDRAFSADPEIVAKLGRTVCEGLQSGGVIPVIKHVPGHGRANADSHLELPHVDTKLEVLIETDFAPFKALNNAPAAMTAHVVYSALDDKAPCSTSELVIRDVVRGQIGFDGLLFSDDIGMKALSGPLVVRISSVLQAGCDIALHCDGNFEAMVEIAASCPPMGDKSLDRLRRAKSVASDSQDFDAEAAKRRISGFFKI
tara:strand:+ start:165 stop:1193 length:1029 start_codon:yes stop_codon:yes gene_type:complete